MKNKSLERKISGAKVQEIYENTYAITDTGFGTIPVFMYLLVGDESALLIDCGYGMLDLNKIVHQITEKPFVCACTHGHLDHALGAGQIEKVYMHSAELPVYRKHSDREFLRMSANRGLLNGVSKKKRNDPDYQEVIEKFASVKLPDEILPLESVEEFQLGNRRVTWRLLPGHTPGSVAFYDERYNALFDSDGASSGLWLYMEESMTLKDYRPVLVDYIQYARSLGDPKRYCGHQSSPSSVHDLEKLLERVDLALNKSPVTIPYNTPFGHADILFSKGGALFYNKKKIC